MKFPGGLPPAQWWGCSVGGSERTVLSRLAGVLWGAWESLVAPGQLGAILTGWSGGGAGRSDFTLLPLQMVLQPAACPGLSPLRDGGVSVLDVVCQPQPLGLEELMCSDRIYPTNSSFPLKK